MDLDLELEGDCEEAGMSTDAAADADSSYFAGHGHPILPARRRVGIGIAYPYPARRRYRDSKRTRRRAQEIRSHSTASPWLWLWLWLEETGFSDTQDARARVTVCTGGTRTGSRGGRSISYVIAGAASVIRVGFGRKVQDARCKVRTEGRKKGSSGQALETHLRARAHAPDLFFLSFVKGKGSGKGLSPLLRASTLARSRSCYEDLAHEEEWSTMHYIQNATAYKGRHTASRSSLVALGITRCRRQWTREGPKRQEGAICIRGSNSGTCRQAQSKMELHGTFKMDHYKNGMGVGHKREQWSGRMAIDKSVRCNTPFDGRLTMEWSVTRDFSRIRQTAGKQKPSPPPPTAAAMMLVQKQPHFSIQLAQPAFIHQHRRHPSAPPPQVLAVQPTRTPGLLSLSRPPRPPKDHHKGSPKSRPAQPAASRSPKLAEASATAPTPSHDNNVPSRGRNNNNPPKQRPARSSSHAAPTRRRQPSPDPFRTPPQTQGAPPPNKRRGPNAIPVPGATRPHVQIPPAPSASPSALSRSDPVLSHMPQQRKAKPVPVRAATLDEWPVCDDMTEAGSRPSTPTPVSPTQDRRQQQGSGGSPSPSLTRPRPVLHLSEPRTPTRRTRLPEPPRTAPLSSVSPGAFPFPASNVNASNGNSNNNGGSPHGSPKRRPAAAAKRAKHLSEGFTFPPFNPQYQTQAQGERRSRSSERSEGAYGGVGVGVGAGVGQGQGQTYAQAQAQATLFASSMFQNSPSPEELPPPTFA
ncbi:hypothetical protein C8F04DRAFT_1180080 [Mycena alexandri]|uniref:Uncharacterized protein n=1 Tax=Mycena alexandri TaxID=1745969 RepID=A0AAD6T534_9AGAR|nr:hypothetical protein C8F04DRAFT_1180080 [Mycena alexandri]